MKLYKHLTEETWVKGRYRSLVPGQGGCLLYHVMEHYGGVASYGSVMSILTGTILILYPERVGKTHRLSALDTTIVFNDHSKTTLEDVLRVCKVADI